jgi:bifunctional NMN adenylyltransferase/nudix hydrolase
MNKYKYDYAVFIGRLQPPHKEHINQIKRGLELANNVIIALGSHRAAPNIKNPWNAQEREEMVRVCFSKLENTRLIFVQVRDYYYNDTAWFTDLHNSVMNQIYNVETSSICVLGSNKDESSWYLDALPESWKRELSIARNVTHATEIRNLYFQNNPQFTNNLAKEVTDYLTNWEKTTTYTNLVEEWKFIKDYKDMWAMAPYPVTFVTTDVLVVKNAHVLVIRRKFNPGKGLLALPGGFVNQNETIIDSAFRELKEETRILVPKDTLMKYIVDQRVFDNPSRSLRGRTITNAFCVKLPDGGQLPQVKGDDDAERAIWIPIADLFIKESEFYEDHLHIINYFTNKL